MSDLTSPRLIGLWCCNGQEISGEEKGLGTHPFTCPALKLKSTSYFSFVSYLCT